MDLTESTDVITAGREKKKWNQALKVGDSDWGGRLGQGLGWRAQGHIKWRAEKNSWEWQGKEASTKIHGAKAGARNWSASTETGIWLLNLQRLKVWRQSGNLKQIMSSVHVGVREQCRYSTFCRNLRSCESCFQCGVMILSAVLAWCSASWVQKELSLIR